MSESMSSAHPSNLLFIRTSHLQQKSLQLYMQTRGKSIKVPNFGLNPRGSTKTIRKNLFPRDVSIHFCCTSKDKKFVLVYQNILQLFIVVQNKCITLEHFVVVHQNISQSYIRTFCSCILECFVVVYQNISQLFIVAQNKRVTLEHFVVVHWNILQLYIGTSCKN